MRARYRDHVGGVVQLLLYELSGRCGDIAWSAYQFGNQIADPSSVLDVSVEIEARRPALCPKIPGNGRSAVGVDEDSIAVEQQPVDVEADGVVHEETI